MVVSLCLLKGKLERSPKGRSFLNPIFVAQKKALSLLFWVNNMAPGRDSSKDDGERHQKIVNQDSVYTEEEKGTTQVKPMIVWKEKQGISVLNVLHELLHCPVCKSLMYPPIQQCTKGHTLCVNCKTRVHNSCPTCCVELGDIRCLALERVAALLELSCIYENAGCLVKRPYYSKVRHEQHCRYRPYNCPHAGSECSVTGDIPTLVAHLKDEHMVDMHYGPTFNHRYVKTDVHEVENAIWMLTVFNCFERHFCLHFEASQLDSAPVYMAFLRYMGEDTEARKFRYSLEVTGDGRKLVWQGVPRSIRDSHKKVRDSQDGLIIPRILALLFSGRDTQELKLSVSGRIWKEL